MPNHCYTNLLIDCSTEKPIGTARDLDAFAACARSGDEALSFERLVPMPPALTDDAVAESLGTSVGRVTGDTGFPSWWDWAYANWGTKWDCWDSRLERVYHLALDYDLTTAWSPPFDFVARVLRDLFPSLRATMRYADEFRGFAGWTTMEVVDGEVVAHQRSVEPP